MTDIPIHDVDEDDTWRFDPDHANLKILREVGQIGHFVRNKAAVEPIRQICLVDTETTGTDPQVDQIIDLAYLILAVDDEDDIVGIVCADQALCDPMMPIPARVSLLTGLTDEMVAGKAIDLDRVELDIASVDVFIAHNAAFDVSFVRQLLPTTQNAAWACSLKDFDWLADAQLGGKALGHLLMEIGFFHSGHRAMEDVVALLHILSYRLADGRTVLSALLANAEEDTVKVEAVGAPYSARIQLKARGYRWDPKGRAWWTEVAEHEVDDEELWLGRQVLHNGPSPRLTRITWRERHR
ncbi:3'-5' exonuclease [Sphingomonas sp. 35-24ZXX]|uniref:3'-5' exonuclease n=1 Tax=Sphingomonas sp. 35-24ZXX TaxID=1545915 RepID=UPI00068F52DB|nr:3'-5' exonuclease [Sphingomonas sp. 35-24ZXX]